MKRKDAGRKSEIMYYFEEECVRVCNYPDLNSNPQTLSPRLSLSHVQTVTALWRSTVTCRVEVTEVWERMGKMEEWKEADEYEQGFNLMEKK